MAVNTAAIDASNGAMSFSICLPLSIQAWLWRLSVLPELWLILSVRLLIAFFAIFCFFLYEFTQVIYCLFYFFHPLTSFTVALFLHFSYTLLTGTAMPSSKERNHIMNLFAPSLNPKRLSRHTVLKHFIETADMNLYLPLLR